MIVPIYASLLALLFIYLSKRALTIRKQEQVAVGTGESKKLLRATRVHGNFTEYTPITLLLLYMLEQNSANDLYLHFSGMLLLLGRCVHAYGVSQLREKFQFRVAGMAATLISLGSSAIYLLVLSITV